MVCVVPVLTRKLRLTLNRPITWSHLRCYHWPPWGTATAMTTMAMATKTMMTKTATATTATKTMYRD